MSEAKVHPIFSFFVLLFSAMGTSAGGSIYAFGIFAPDLKDATMMDQTQLNIVFAVIYVGSGVAAPIMFFTQKIGHKKGFLGLALTGAVAWALATLCLTKDIKTPFPLMIIAFMLIGLWCNVSYAMGCGWVHEHKSEWDKYAQDAAMVGFGIGGALFSLLFLFAFNGFTAYDRLFWFFILLGCSYTAAPLLCLIFSLLAENCDQASTYGSLEETLAISSTPTVNVNSSSMLDHDDDEEIHLLIPRASVKPVPEHQQQETDTVTAGQFILIQIKSLNFWLLVIMMITMVSIGAGVQANLGHMVLSRGAPADIIPILDVLFSIAQCVGRFSLILLARGYTHRIPFAPIFIWPVGGILGALGCFLYFVPDNHVLYAVVFFVAMLYGMNWTSAAVFGGSALERGTDPGGVMRPYALLSFMASVGPPVIDAVVGMLYDRNVPPGQLECSGLFCFTDGIILLGVSAVVASLCGLLVTHRVAAANKRAQLL